MKKILILLAFSLLFSTVLQAQTKSIKKTPPLSEANPETVGISPERLARIDQMCNEAVANNQVPGVVSLVARNGKIVHWKAYGMADNAAGKKMERDAIFRIASQTKAVTATAVLT